MKTVVVTGATSGIGLAVCKELLANGYRVIWLGHSEKNCAAAKVKLLADNHADDITFFWGDLMQQPEIYRVADEIKKELQEKCDGALYALISNAGCVRSWFMTTGEGYEQQFALNHLAGFLLTHALLKNLIKGGGCVLMTSSGSHRMMKINWGDISFQKRYRPLMAYKQSKLCNMLFACGLNDRYAKCGIQAYGIDPGLVKTDIGCKNTGKLVDFVWRRRQKHGVDPAVPAKVYLQLLSSDPKPSGLYYAVEGEKKYSREVTKQNADKLFVLSETLCKIKFGEA